MHTTKIQLFPVQIIVPFYLLGAVISIEEIEILWNL